MWRRKRNETYRSSIKQWAYLLSNSEGYTNLPAKYKRQRLSRRLFAYVMRRRRFEKAKRTFVIQDGEANDNTLRMRSLQ